MIDISEPAVPPRTRTPEGRPRRVGVELEFAAVSAREGARHVQHLFGGHIEESDPHRYRISGTALGDFVSELDVQYAHRPASPDEAGFDLGASLEGFSEAIRRFVGDVSSLVMPCEIVCPPVEITALPEIARLVPALTEAGAEGTRASPLYAFGAQFNPDVAEGGDEWIVAVFKAYLLMSDWLRAVMSIDLTRRIIAFADPFPRAYVEKVVAPDYWPDMAAFTADYLAANPTRNRELDLLPLLAWFDEDRVRRQVKDKRVKRRPTFHYRLPDANLGQPGWGILLEWNRWCLVERLAERRDTLDRMGAAYLEGRARVFKENWAIRTSEWLLLA